MTSLLTVTEATQSASPSSEPRDRWLLGPTLTLLAGTLVLAFFCGWPGLISFTLIPLTFLGLPFVTIALLVLTAVFAIQKRFRRAASMLAAILLPILLLKPINWAANCLHLSLTASFGIGQLGSVSVPKDAQFYVFDWSVGLAGGPNTFLIHDVTDEIALPLDQHKYPIETERGFGEDCAGKVQHLLGHYYVCTF